ncbi:MAG: hypothetical protein KAR65_02575 [Anaerolineales bacterium]|nr:hypothetical protein [Anaerolineales bacterium]MCK5633661.1 hypothetical protein [Anaerolineales bacterium]
MNEYRVEVLGGSMISAKPEDLEAMLNEAAEEGWMFLATAPQNNSARLWIILQRTLRESRKKTRRSGHWFSEWG